MNKNFTFALVGAEKTMFEAYKTSLGDVSVKDAVMQLLTQAARQTASVSTPPKLVLKNMYERMELKKCLIWTAHFEYGDWQMKCVSVTMNKKNKFVHVEIPFRIMIDEGEEVKVPVFTMVSKKKQQKLTESMRLHAMEWLKNEGWL